MEQPIQNMEEPVQIPQQYLCPISTQIMKDPVVAGDGITYQRQSIEKWFEKSNNSALTGKRLPHKTLITNYALKNAIQNFTKKLPAIMKQKHIRINLQCAIKMREEQMNDYLNKIEKKYAKLQKQDQFESLTSKQLSRELKISIKSHQQTQKLLAQALDKIVAMQVHIQELTEELKTSKSKQCKCKINQKIKQQKIKQINLIKKQKIPEQKQHQKKKFSKQVQSYVNEILTKNFKQQKKLKLQSIKLNGDHIQYITNCINVKKLNYLYLNKCNIDDYCMKVLFNDQKKLQYPQLQSLQLKNNIISDQGLQYLCNAELRLPKLWGLYLTDTNQIGIKGINILGRSKLIMRITQLYIQNTFNGDQQQDCIRLLFQSNKQYNKLSALDISYNNIGNKGLSYLNQKQFPSLSCLFIDNNKISLQGIKSLMKNHKLFPNISLLNLNNNDLCSQSIKALTSQKQMFIKLQKLFISNNPKIGDKGVNYLIQQKGLTAFPSLKSLKASYCNATNCDDKIKKTKQKYPHIQAIEL